MRGSRWTLSSKRKQGHTDDLWRGEQAHRAPRSATGMVGGHCLELLLQDDAWEQVAVLGRREVETTHRKLVQRVVDFDRLAELGEVPRVDDVFCCLGTTIKHAGSEEAFRRVDFTYVHELAQLASRHRAGQFLLVSALGADRQSRVSQVDHRVALPRQDRPAIPPIINARPGGRPQVAPWAILCDPQ